MLILNKNILTIGGNRLEGGPLTPPEPPGPPVLPPNTVRVRTNDGNVPNKGSSASYETATLVPGTSDVYDVYKSGTDFKNFLADSNNVVEVLGANTTGITIMMSMFKGCTSLSTVPLFDTSNVTNMSSMFKGCTSLTTVPIFNTSNVTNMGTMFQSCTSLTTVPLFDTSKVSYISNMFKGCTSLTTVPIFNTSNVTNMGSMFEGCTSLTSVPLFDTSKVSYMPYMFSDCINVQSGALALYQQASTQTNPPFLHAETFTNCGINTQTGSAELAQIPGNWGGTGD